MAKVKLGEVLSTYIAPVGSSGVRDERSFIELKEGYGIIDDKFANKELNKSVMIVGKKPYSMAKDNSIDIPASALGENILLSFDPHILDIGDRVVLGSSVIEITEVCTLCSHLAKYSKKLPKLILNHRGVYCRVIKSGVVTVGDDVLKES